ncbi:Uncharacterised protein [Klebsiella pneumoniae]|nr:hypothetical protein PAERUG_E15_London_28_01_14_09777 [Pseudomonas aeruginosa]CRX29499.1 hypothetical protein PAERUG_P54_1_London_24_VIM_2_04_13_05976 [Pseudomonas aeruginosa]SVJ78622.1 Uncharacterised protein [Klebsiella pneumoniae]
MPKASDRAISRPPATTIGNMNDTPVSRCLYTPRFSSLATTALAAPALSTCPSASARSSVARACLRATPVPQR